MISLIILQVRAWISTQFPIKLRKITSDVAMLLPRSCLIFSHFVLFFLATVHLRLGYRLFQVSRSGFSGGARHGGSAKGNGAGQRENRRTWRRSRGARARRRSSAPLIRSTATDAFLENGKHRPIISQARHHLF